MKYYTELLHLQMRLHNKTCLITGGAKGLGESQARLFAKEGARIIIADILEERGALVAEDIHSKGYEAMFCKLDTTVELDWANTINTIPIVVFDFRK